MISPKLSRIQPQPSLQADSCLRLGTACYAAYWKASSHSKGLRILDACAFGLGIFFESRDIAPRQHHAHHRNYLAPCLAAASSTTPSLATSQLPSVQIHRDSTALNRPLQIRSQLSPVQTPAPLKTNAPCPSIDSTRAPSIDGQRPRSSIKSPDWRHQHLQPRPRTVVDGFLLQRHRRT